MMPPFVMAPAPGEDMRGQSCQDATKITYATPVANPEIKKNGTYGGIFSSFKFTFFIHMQHSHLPAFMNQGTSGGRSFDIIGTRIAGRCSSDQSM